MDYSSLGREYVINILIQEYIKIVEAQTIFFLIFKSSSIVIVCLKAYATMAMLILMNLTFT